MENNKIILIENIILLKNFYKSKELYSKIILEPNEVVFILTLKHIKIILNKYISGEISNSDLFEWADFLELRDEIDYKEGENEKIANILFNIASQDINGYFNRKKAIQTLEKIKSPK